MFARHLQYSFIKDIMTMQMQGYLGVCSQQMPENLGKVFQQITLYSLSKNDKKEEFDLNVQTYIHIYSLCQFSAFDGSQLSQHAQIVCDGSYYQKDFLE
ncbi:UNKNOWN [Stylonychia lemnae]|uniref:Uncharacterized protein n=1 Tax=Stylonychia lemnae TaxID=5949 RepID=A0A077ZNF8_STYLE|nr:UNKNOWN [Stylonychia lemnae]|eukprot:CDW71512.1 UNKNOWN [Stylonychia lemnae]